MTKKERQKIYLEASKLTIKEKCGCYSLYVAKTGNKNPDFSKWMNFDLKQFPEYYLFKNGDERQTGGWFRGNSEERTLAMLLAAEMCKD